MSEEILQGEVVTSPDDAQQSLTSLAQCAQTKPDIAKTSPAPKKRKRRVSTREVKPRRFLAGLLDGKSQKQAALDAGYSQETSRSQTRAVMETLRSQFVDLLDIEIPRAKLVGRLNELLDATTQTFFLHQKTGEVVASPTVPDNKSRLEALRLASQIFGLLVRDVRVTGSGPDGEILFSARLAAAKQRLDASRSEVTAQIVRPLPA